MKKRIGLSVLLFFMVSFIFSDSPNVKSLTGLFDITYPFTLSKGLAGFTFSVDNIDLKTADVDVNVFTAGVAWAAIENLELNLALSYNRVRMLEPGSINAEYPFAERWQVGLGYASVGLKYNFLKNQKTGFGAAGYFDLPLSNEDTAVTTGKPRFGVDLLFAHKFTEKTIFSLNAGYQVNQDPNQFDLPDAVKYAAGIETSIGGPFSVAAQLVGKMYTGGNLEQDDPLDLIVGIKFYDEESNVGLGVAYKKNILFNNKTLADSHGAVGYITYFPRKKEAPACIQIESVGINGSNSAKEGEVRDYQAVYSPETATVPITFNWSSSGSGSIQSGQGTATVSVKWNKVDAGAWVKVVVSNQCSNVSGTMKVNVVEAVEKPKVEYFFAFNSYELSEATIQDLDIAVEYFKYHPDVVIEIEGHTCSIATESYNLALGEHRSEAAKKYLIDKGISPDRIKSISYGEEKPEYDNSQEITRKKNRRAKIIHNK